MCACIHVLHIFAHIHVNKSIHTCVCIYICVCACMPVYIDIGSANGGWSFFDNIYMQI